eukprot:6199964-Pleurochrysis_carterae.AAC.1
MSVRACAILVTLRLRTLFLCCASGSGNYGSTLGCKALSASLKYNESLTSLVLSCARAAKCVDSGAPAHLVDCGRMQS